MMRKLNLEDKKSKDQFLLDAESDPIWREFIKEDLPPKHCDICKIILLDYYDLDTGDIWESLDGYCDSCHKKLNRLFDEPSKRYLWKK